MGVEKGFVKILPRYSQSYRDEKDYNFFNFSNYKYI